MQSGRLPEDGGARMRRWHVRRRRGEEGPRDGPGAGFAIPAMAVAGIVVLVLSCGDGGVEPAPPPVPVATTVTVNPGSATLSALGETTRLTAEVRDQNGQVMAGAAVAWASSDASVASVDASGLVTAAANGSATITATAGPVSGTAAVTVAQVVSAVAVSPATDTLVSFGDTVRLIAEATDANGHGVAAVTEFVWSSSDTLVARVDDSGLVESLAEGEAVVMATAAEVTGGAELSVVSPLPTTIAVSPDTLRLTALGQTAQLAAAVREQAGRVMAEALVSWSSGDSLVVVVDSAGRVTAVGRGTTIVTAVAGDVSDAAVATVMQSAGSVVMSPDEGRIAVGDTLRLAADAFDENGHRVDGTEFLWSSSDGATASVDDSGLVTGVGEGTVRITARAGDATGTAEITVENPDRAALVALYEATDGPNWVDSDGWLTDAPLGKWYGVRTDESGRVRWLVLSRNELAGPMPRELGSLTRLEVLSLASNKLTGPIPTDLGNLAKLRRLELNRNRLTGEIPPELGNLVDLIDLNLGSNGLTGEIPPELGNLGNLETLEFWGNHLTGEVPSELGSLANLASLGLGENNLIGQIPTELGSLSDLRTLYLRGNELSGAIPAELGGLANLTELDLGDNELTGSIPRSYLHLDLLTTFFFAENAGLCAPGSADFATWIGAIERNDGPFCNAADRAVLESLYDATGGTAWTRSDNWLSTHAVGEWHGVSADSLGMVTALDLAENGLAGKLPASIGTLARITVLRIGGNALSGRLPLSLAAASLQALHYADTGLCVPAEESFQAWLNTIPSHEGTGVDCAPLSDREILEALYHSAGGPEWTYDENWLTEAPIANWFGVYTDNDGRVRDLYLSYNHLTGFLPPELGNLTTVEVIALKGNRQLTGQIPPELGNLTRLTRLDLGFTDVTGSIPPELGQLSELTFLNTWRARLSGSIPPELGNLVNLTELALGENELTGSIPPELGRLRDLQSLFLVRNALTGPIPPELGNLSKLELLSLDQNDLTGTIPGEMGRLTNLKELGVANNARMSGVLSASLTALLQLEAFGTGGTGLCAPTDPAFQAWLAGIHKRRVAICNSGDAPAAYLVQAVQSWDNPVPLVAGEKALLRVFPTVRRATGESIPAVQARFYLDGRETHVQDIPGKLEAIPTAVDEGDLAKSVNAEIPGYVVQPGLEMVIEVDPAGTLDPALGVARRIPKTGRLRVEVRAMPTLDLTVVPFLWTVDPDSAILDITSGMAADPANHEMLWATRTLLPVGDLDVRAHEPVLTTTNRASTFFAEAVAIRALEGGTGHFMAMMSGDVDGPGGFAQGNRLSFARPWAPTVAHELGHNMSLDHAPCGGAAGLDGGFPYPDGSIGAWGYDFEAGGALVSPGRPDLMAYCRPRWISDYHFTNTLRYRLVDEGAPEAAAIAESTKSLLLWGGIRTDSVPFLEPTFVVDAQPELPRSGGEYQLTGKTVDGAALFSLSFGMPEVADGDGSSTFAFVLPVRAEWEGNLASVTLTGPGGSFTLNSDSDIPMAILRNPRNGQVRGILRDLTPGNQVAAYAVGEGVGNGLEVLFSRGVPDVVAWSR